MTEIQKEVEEFGFQKSVFPCEEREHVGSQTSNNELPRVWESTSVLSAGPAETTWRTDVQILPSQHITDT